MSKRYSLHLSFYYEDSSGSVEWDIVDESDSRSYQLTATTKREAKKIMRALNRQDRRRQRQISIDAKRKAKTVV